MTSEEKSSPSRRELNSLLGVLQSIFRWKRQIVRVCAAAGIGTAIIVLFLPNYYESKATFLALSPDQVNPDLLFNRASREPYYFGGQSDIDRVLTIAESNELIDYLVDSFKLYEHYDINPENKKAPVQVRKKFLSLYTVNKTKRDAIEIIVEDKDPELAAAIAATAMKKTDLIAQRILKENQVRIIDAINIDLQHQQEKIKQLSDTMYKLRQFYSIFNPVSQTELLSAGKSQAEANIQNLQAQIDAYNRRGGRYLDSIPQIEAKLKGYVEEERVFNGLLDKLNTGMSGFLAMEKQMQDLNRNISDQQAKRNQYESILESALPAILIVEEPQVAIVKSRPQRSFIVFAAVFITLVLAVVTVLLLESSRDVNWREIYHG
jgi:tyrosine-protein kinase Etk/Wzc